MTGPRAGRARGHHDARRQLRARDPVSAWGREIIRHGARRGGTGPGIQAIDTKLLEVADIFQYRRAALARHVLLPAALPAFVTGLRSGLGLGWMFVVAAELMGASRGLGYLMVDGQTTSRPELILAAILLFALLGKASDWLLARLGARLQPWRSQLTAAR